MDERSSLLTKVGRAYPTSAHFLDWDSEFFGFRIAKITATSLTEDEWPEILKWSRQEEIDCLYFLVDAAESNSIRFAEQMAFQLVDIRITLECNLAKALKNDVTNAKGVSIRPAQVIDIPKLRKLARTLYTQTRFFNDPHFPRKRVHELYETWIDQNCRRRSDQVLVAELQGDVVGFASGVRTPNKSGRVDLVGVHPRASGSRIGRLLLTRLVKWFQEAGMNKALVSTQGSNVTALRLYEKSSFFLRDIQIWYHKWFHP